MCKRGDIILVEKYKDHGKEMSRHSFVVIDDEGGQVLGMSFDFIALVMSSFKSEEQRKKKLSYPGNFPITATDENIGSHAHGKDGYIKAEQFYYFDKTKTNFSVIGTVNVDTFDVLLEFIESLEKKGVRIEEIVDNLK